jgi:PLP dependent protein
VTKGHEVGAALAALAVGALDLGENYATELLDKAAAVESLRREPPQGEPPDPRWHFLGAVQRNKVRRLAPVVACWQSVSRPEEALAIARCRENAEIFVEVDTTAKAGRGGCAPSEAASVLEAALRAGCKVRGLMTVAPLVAGASTAETAAEAFGTVAELAAKLGLAELSMGMSHDLEQAVAAGSTMIRIGTALFGERSSR